MKVFCELLNYEEKKCERMGWGWVDGKNKGRGML